MLLISYGSNVAFEAEQGLVKFRGGLSRLLDTLQPTGVRIVLMSPPPREIRGELEGNLKAQNRWLAKVADHLQQVAPRRDCHFVDLFNRWPSMADQPDRYTDNGIHLNDVGYEILSEIVLESLGLVDPPWRVHLQADGAISQSDGAEISRVQRTEYGLRWMSRDARLPPVRRSPSDSSPQRLLQLTGLDSGTYSLDIDGQRVARGTGQEWASGMVIARGPDLNRSEKLRQTIVEKNRLYFYGFRPQNKAYIHLFRRHERGHHAAELRRFGLLVDAAEEQISRLRLPRQRIYELVREKDYPDHEVPGERTVADVIAEQAALNIPAGFEITLFASDPMISKPININWDAAGRMWVATSTIYPHLQPGQSPDDKIIILEDLDHDGRADTSHVFADGLLVPHSVIPGNGGAFVTQSTDLLFLRDRDGDGRAEEKQVLLTGFGNADVHHMIHALRWGPDGDLYFNQSIYINSVVETPWGVRVSNGSCIWRLRPETLQLEIFNQGLVNPWGHAFDAWGQSLPRTVLAAGELPTCFQAARISPTEYAGRSLSSMNPGRPKECGLEYLSGRHLPQDWQGTFLTSDFRANRVTRYRLTEDGSGYSSAFLGDMVTSSHRGFRPVDVKVGPDGAIYIVDWYNLIIDHGEVDFHHPLRDKRHGRIWRLAAKDSPSVEPLGLPEATTHELLNSLTVAEQWTRDQARRLLRSRGPEQVLPVLAEWLAESERSDHDRLEALWVSQGMRQVNADLLRRCLESKDHRVRAAAVRVLSDWHGQVDGSRQHFEKAVLDEHPQVRLEAVNGLRRVGTRDAATLAMAAVELPTDRWLEFALFRTAHESREKWLEAFQDGEDLFAGSPQRIAFALSSAGARSAVQPLADLVSSDRLKGDRLVNALRVLAALGDTEQRALALDRTIQLPERGKIQVLESFAQSERDRIPDNAILLQRLLDVESERVRQLSLGLAGRWQLTQLRDDVAKRAGEANLSTDERLTAARALVVMDRSASAAILRSIFEQAATLKVRVSTVAAWAQVSAAEAAPQAVGLLAELNDAESVQVVADAFLNQRDGPEQLTAALDGERIPASVAQRVIEEVRMTGREMPELIKAIRVAGKLELLAKNLSAEQVAAILERVATQGDVVRGKAIFGRDRLRCLACHAVGGTGGQVGPDLGSLGGSARLGDILQSLLNPSASIKEGYQTSHISLQDGRIVTGIIRQQTEQFVTIRDANNKLHTIPSDDIDDIDTSRLSVMPTGLTELLSEAELVDLVRYLASLGR